MREKSGMRGRRRKSERCGEAVKIWADGENMTRRNDVEMRGWINRAYGKD